ncbi:YhjD/YihY/BrkB family envelope integrity protein [Methylotenera versatilis]|uniref:Cyclic nucleotide-binding protein n=1 Tax=Methylotenera versatilis (strain 301) TaxID=666681 RepID=D7DMQ0_METV0|nr:YhjD/YihY/BrkB family envelope integrity protein [Methylotenera versatilis]ADI30827.1 cyclic nucleotide-binding protein [Methylotenera versatilis 301]
MKEETNTKQQSSLQSALNKPLEAYGKQRYSTPLFVLHEMFGAFRRHNVLGLSASLSFYAMFALIPLVLLLFFLLSHLVFTSDYAVVKLAIITGNLAPKFSSAIMVEVYNTAQQKAAWGAAGLFVLLWTVTPLASAMRTSFYTIATLVEAPSYIHRKLKDIIAVIGMLVLFFLFTFAGLMLEKVITFLGANHQFFQYDMIAALTSLVLTTLLIAAFYFVFFPVRLNLKHILIGALFTAVLWLLMRPAFTLFLSLNESYGSVFGSMKNLFISITWLYFNFSVFLLGTELIATLRKKDVLILKGLFADNQQAPQSKSQTNYLEKLMQRYGRSFQQGEFIFKQGDLTRNLHYLVSGQVQLMKNDNLLRTIEAGEYFGEMAMLTNTPAIADAVVSSKQADVILIYPDNIETLLLDEPKVAMKFLRQMASRLQAQSNTDVS